MEWVFVGTCGRWILLWNAETQKYRAVRAADDDGVEADSITGVCEKAKERDTLDKANKTIGGV